MAEITDRLRHILSGKSPEPEPESKPAHTPGVPPIPDAPLREAQAEPLPVMAPFVGTFNLPPDEAILQDETEPPAALDEVVLPATPPMPTDVKGARAYQAEIQRKMTALAEDFSLGKISRRQFEAVYAHYREQRQMIDALIHSMDSEAWRKAVSEGLTGPLLERNAAQILSYAMYDNATILPLAMSSQFKLDGNLIAPLLAAYRASTAELTPKISSSEIEGGRWLCFVPGHATTLIVLYSLEPARAQLTFLQDLHHDFELANAKRLSQGRGRECAEQFMRLWALERMT
jgi:hypothetical protein